LGSGSLSSSVLSSSACAAGAGSGTEDTRRITITSLAVAPPRQPAPEWSDAGSEEDIMSTIVLSNKAQKLMKLCEAEGFDKLDDLLALVATDSVCPAICMTEGCDYTAEMEPDQTEGYCEACGGNTVASVLVLAGLI
jgi:hypothetical protein